LVGRIKEEKVTTVNNRLIAQSEYKSLAKYFVPSAQLSTRGSSTWALI